MIQGSLTGECFPVEKFVVETQGRQTSPLELDDLAFLGTSVGSGSADRRRRGDGQGHLPGRHGRVARRSKPAERRSTGASPASRCSCSASWLVMVPLVFVINGVTKGTWGEAFFFALAVAVGLTPEMLPMIVTICLSKGAVAMGKKKVIVKRINAIQNLGAMDVLCTDKTGTLTRDEIILERHCDVALREDDGVLALAYINSHFQTGLKNVLDRAVLAHEESHASRARPGAREGRRDPVRLRAADHVGRRPHAGRERPHHLQGRSRGDLPAMRELRARREAPADGPPSHRGAEEGVRAAERRRLPRAGHRHEGCPAARSRRAAPRPMARPTSAT